MKRVVVPETCLYENDVTLICSLMRMQVEHAARVIALREDMSLLEAEESMEEPDLKIAASAGKEGGYIQVEGKWYRIPSGFSKIDHRVNVGELVFNDKGGVHWQFGRWQEHLHGTEWNYPWRKTGCLIRRRLIRFVSSLVWFCPKSIGF